ncbi:MAG: DUF2752 domain-containing protein, partial [Candidatus Sumerlaeia bacterium]|nr:DUF2752 domain-containing protein [Candidatus Sumerlaeia bacterium]
MDSVDSTLPTQPEAPPKPVGFFTRLARETKEAGAVILDMIFHPVAHLVALVAVLAGLIIFPLTNIHQMYPGCSFLLSTGIPCPGCGMTRSVMATYRLDFLTAIKLNPMGPLFALLFVFLGFFIFLPGSVRRSFRDKLRPIEGHLAIAVLLLFLV